MVCDPEQDCAVHLQIRLAKFLNLVGICFMEIRYIIYNFFYYTYMHLGIFTCWTSCNFDILELSRHGTIEKFIYVPTDLCVCGAMQGLRQKKMCTSVANKACWAIDAWSCCKGLFSSQLFNDYLGLCGKGLCMLPTPPPSHFFQVLSKMCILFHVIWTSIYLLQLFFYVAWEFWPKLIWLHILTKFCSGTMHWQPIMIDDAG